ncbi:E1-E2 ATPase-domain-containing protein [Mycena floridula]|nr:E1-E2 ATPase-domain-containing protein [Mycena floridula]
MSFESTKASIDFANEPMLDGRASRPALQTNARRYRPRACCINRQDTGTLVRNGRGTGVVIAAGTGTEFGVIFSMMQDVEEKRTPLQLFTDELAKKLSITSFGVLGVICLIGVLQKRSWPDMFTIGVLLVVTAIPKGLPIVTTVTLARPMNDEAKSYYEEAALGGRIREQAYVVDENIVLDPSALSYHRIVLPAFRKALEVGAICNNALLARNEDRAFVGQSMDVALLNVLDVVRVPDTRGLFKHLSECPFNSEQKYMAVSGTASTRA